MPEQLTRAQVVDICMMAINPSGSLPISYVPPPPTEDSQNGVIQLPNLIKKTENQFVFEYTYKQIGHNRLLAKDIETTYAMGEKLKKLEMGEVTVRPSCGVVKLNYMGETEMLEMIAQIEQRANEQTAALRLKIVKFRKVHIK